MNAPIRLPCADAIGDIDDAASTPSGVAGGGTSGGGKPGGERGGGGGTSNGTRDGCGGMYAPGGAGGRGIAVGSGGGAVRGGGGFGSGCGCSGRLLRLCSGRLDGMSGGGCLEKAACGAAIATDSPLTAARGGGGPPASAASSGGSDTLLALGSARPGDGTAAVRASTPAFTASSDRPPRLAGAVNVGAATASTTAAADCFAAARATRRRERLTRRACEACARARTELAGAAVLHGLTAANSTCVRRCACHARTRAHLCCVRGSRTRRNAARASCAHVARRCTLIARPHDDDARCAARNTALAAAARGRGSVIVPAVSAAAACAQPVIAHRSHRPGGKWEPGWSARPHLREAPRGNARNAPACAPVSTCVANVSARLLRRLCGL